MTFEPHASLYFRALAHKAMTLTNSLNKNFLKDVIYILKDTCSSLEI